MRYIGLIVCLLIVFGGAYACDSATNNAPKRIHGPIGPHRQIRPKEACKIKPVVVAVIDTGFGAGFAGEENVHLCKFGHKNFVNDDNKPPEEFDTKVPVPRDPHGHGTHIAGIIDSIAKKAGVNYCLVILRYYNPDPFARSNADATVEAIKYATMIHADFINYSGGGTWENKFESMAVKKFLDGGGKFIAAAGNEKSDLSKYPYYPAMSDSRVIVVGNGFDEKSRAPTSNYGNRVNRWEYGTNVKSLGQVMTGTSQSAAIETGKILAATKNACK